MPVSEGASGCDLRAALNSVVGKSGVAALLSGRGGACGRRGSRYLSKGCEAGKRAAWQGRHRVRKTERLPLVCYADRGMSAPQCPLLLRAQALQRELLHMADHFERALGGICAPLSWYVVNTSSARAGRGRNQLKLFAGIGDARGSEEMTLLADAVACGEAGVSPGLTILPARESARWFFGGTVAAFAGDRFFGRRKFWRAVFIQRSGERAARCRSGRAHILRGWAA